MPITRFHFLLRLLHFCSGSCSFWVCSLRPALFALKIPCEVLEATIRAIPISGLFCESRRRCSYAGLHCSLTCCWIWIWSITLSTCAILRKIDISTIWAFPITRLQPCHGHSFWLGRRTSTAFDISGEVEIATVRTKPIARLWLFTLSDSFGFRLKSLSPIHHRVERVVTKTTEDKR